MTIVPKTPRLAVLVGILALVGFSPALRADTFLLNVAGGGHILASSGGRGTFSLSVRQNDDLTISGHIDYRDRDGDVDFTATSITYFAGIGSTAQIDGVGMYNGVEVLFNLNATDNGGSDLDDHFYLSIGGAGYSAEGFLKAGNITFQRNDEPPVGGI